MSVNIDPETDQRVSVQLFSTLRARWKSWKDAQALYPNGGSLVNTTRAALDITLGQISVLVDQEGVTPEITFTLEYPDPE